MIGALIMLIIIEYRFLYVLVPSGIVMILFTYLFRKNLKKMHKDIQESDGKLRVFMQERISSLIIVKSFGTEKKLHFQHIDEATSSLDEKTERQVLDNIRNMTDKTVIIVTHRPAALEICNKILEFSEKGTELIK